MKKISCYIMLSIAISGCVSFYDEMGNGRIKTRGMDSEAVVNRASEYCKGKGKSYVIEQLTPATSCTLREMCTIAYLTFSCK